MKIGDGLDAHIRAHLEEHGRISWRTALGIAEWVIYPALAVRLTAGKCKEFMVEKGRWRETHNVIYRILRRKYAIDNGAISDGNRGIIYANWQKPEGASAAPELAKKKRGRPRGPAQVPPQAQAPD